MNNLKDYVPDESYKDFIPIDISISLEEAKWLREIMYTPIIKDGEDVEDLIVWRYRIGLLKTLGNVIRKYGDQDHLEIYKEDTKE